MNDPHVEALIYRIEHRPTVNYEDAEAFEYDGPKFKVRIDEGRARFEPNSHFSKAEEAREAIEPYIRTWEIDAGLQLGPGELDFIFDYAEIIDRDPPPGTLRPLSARIRATSALTATLSIRRNRYPNFPEAIAVNPDIRSMYDRYREYAEGREPLPSMVYFCYTVLLNTVKGRQTSGAEKKYRVERSVLATLAKLASEKGGRAARKARGVGADYTDAERKWIDAAVKTVIRRAAQVAHDPDTKLPMITMTDLPNLRWRSPRRLGSQ